STPETRRRWMTSSLLQAGPRVAMIFVRRMVRHLLARGCEERVVSSFDETMRLMKRRVLVAEDDDCVRTLCVTALRREGYHVESAVDGRAALSRLDLNDYHAVVLDLNMPYLHGATLLSILTQTKPAMLRRVVVM